MKSILFLAVILIIQSHSNSQIHNEELCDELKSVPKTGSPPSSREGSAVQYFTNESVLGQGFLIFGGLDGSKRYMQDMHFFKIDSNEQGKWITLETNGDMRMPRRSFFAHFIVDDDLIIFGGSGPQGFYADMFAFNIETKTWRQIDQGEVSSLPSARESMSFSQYGNKFFIFGGRNVDGKQNDVWQFDYEQRNWKELNITNKNNSSDSPLTCSGGGMHAQLNKIFVYGGYTSKGAQTMDAYCLDISKEDKYEWRRLHYNTTGNQTDYPEPRTDAGYAQINNISICFGGYYKGNNVQYHKNDDDTPHYVQDILFIDFSSDNGTKDALLNYKSVKFDYIYSRELCATTVDQGNEIIYVFGGVRDGFILGDTLKIMNNTKLNNMNSNQQNQLFTQNQDLIKNEINITIICPPIDNIPSPRGHHRAVSALGRMWIFGGRIQMSSSGNDGVDSQTSLSNELFTYDFETQIWNRIVPISTSAIPPGRELFCFVEHSARLFVFGGRIYNPNTGQSENANDLWEYSIIGNFWRKIEPKVNNQQLQKNNHHKNTIRNYNKRNQNEINEQIIIPSGRYGSYAQVLHKNIYVFGGRLDDLSVSNELWKFSLVDYTWMNITLQSCDDIMNAECGLNKYKQYQIKDDPILEGREDCFLAQFQIIINSTQRDILVIGGGVSESRQRVLTLQRILLPIEEQGITYYDTYDMPDKSIYKNTPIYYQSYTTQSEFGFISYAGLDVDDTKNRLNYWKVSDFTNVQFLFDERKEYFVYSCGGSSVLFGRNLYIFGGNVVGQKLPAENQFHNQLYQLNLNSEFFSCSPGTREIQLDNKSECQSCKQGQFNKNWNIKEQCQECLPGSFNQYQGGQTGYHCIACDQDTYNDINGSSKCKQCEQDINMDINIDNTNDENILHTNERQISNQLFEKLNQFSMIGVRDEIYNNKPYCPVGSASQNNTKPPLKFSSETNKDINQQPQPLRTHDDKSTLWMLIGYGGGILLGLIVIIFMFCCKPLRKRLYFFDHLQEMHYDDLNSNSHSTNKIIRQTKLGGILTVFFVCFAIGAASSLIIEFFTNNVDEKKSLVATMMVSELDITQINISRLVASIIFIDHYGVCINQSYEQIVPQDFVKCSDNIQVKTKNIISIGGQILHQCRQFNSTNKFKDPISNCEIQIYASNENISILFPDGSTESEGSEIEELNNKPQISISSLFEDAYCYGIRAQLETSTGIIERQFLNNIDKISKRTVLAVAQNQPFKGNEASIFEFIVAPSKYQSTDNNNSVGYQIMSHTLSPGSTAAGDEMHIKYGLETVIQLKQDSNIIQTIQTSRQKPAQFISNIFSTCIGYLSIFGGILMIIELIAQYRLPKTISESKIGSLRQNLFRPLQDDFENQQNLEIGNLSNNQTENSSNNQTRIANHYQAADQEEGDQN